MTRDRLSSSCWEDPASFVWELIDELRDASTISLGVEPLASVISVFLGPSPEDKLTLMGFLLRVPLEQTVLAVDYLAKHQDALQFPLSLTEPDLFKLADQLSHVVACQGNDRVLSITELLHGELAPTRAMGIMATSCLDPETTIRLLAPVLRGDSDPWNPDFALLRLRFCGPPSLGLLSETLLDADQDSGLRSRLLGTIACIMRSHRVSPCPAWLLDNLLATAAQKEEDSTLRGWALGLLSEHLLDENARCSIFSRHCLDEDPFVRSQSLLLASRLLLVPEPRADALLPFLGDPSRSVKSNAFRLLREAPAASFDTPEVAAILQQLLSNHGDPECQELAVRLVSRCVTHWHRLIAPIQLLFSSPETDVQLALVLCCRDLGEQAQVFVANIVALYPATDASYKSVVLSVLGRIAGADDRIAALCQSELSSADPRVRFFASLYLVVHYPACAEARIVLTSFLDPPSSIFTDNRWHPLVMKFFELSE